MTTSAQQFLAEILKTAGLELNGPRPYDIQVNDSRLYQRVLSGGVLAVGESYMDGWWDCDRLDEMFDRVFRVGLDQMLQSRTKMRWHLLKARLFNLQRHRRAYTVGQEHYDVGNDLYQAMLDKRMAYTCAYWPAAANLEEAQEAKLDLVCRKIDLQPGMHVLDLGCGWGSFAKYAAEKYGAQVTGVTVSREQVKLGNQKCRDLPVEIKYEDYRKVSGLYDRVISIGIMEHVGYKNYRTYMKSAYDRLKDNGLAFIHTIGGNRSIKASNPWTTKYIFPNSMLPSIAQLGRAMEGLFVMEDWHNFGPDYDKTLLAWYDNFEYHWPRFKDQYGERFRRMWRFYLLSSAGAFRSRLIQLWQIVMSKPGTAQPACRLT